jgi:hypothetical protein
VTLVASCFFRGALSASRLVTGKSHLAETENPETGQVRWDTKGYTLWYSDSMGFYGDLIGFYSDLMGFYSVLWEFILISWDFMVI